MREINLFMDGRFSPYPTDFVMVVMPWASTNQPSLQAGLICSLLSKANITASTYYANLVFAAAIGWDHYNEFCDFHNHAGDWLFSETLFGDFKPTGVCGPATFEEYATSVGNDPTAFADLRKLREIVTRCLEQCISDPAWRKVKTVGFTTTMLQPLSSLAFAKKLKEANPHLVILMGGASCQGVMGDALHRLFPFVDGVVDGEADHTIAHIVACTFSRETMPQIPGLHWRDSQGTRSFTPPAPIFNMDDYTLPEYDDFIEQSLAINSPAVENLHIAFESSRGCWWGERRHCAFCGLNGVTLKQRDRPIASVISELETHIQRYKPKLFISTDNIISQHYLREFPHAWRQVKDRPPLFYEVGAAISRHRMADMVDAGISSVQVGIESLSTPALQLMNKGTSAVLNLCFLRRAKELQLRVYWNFMFGIPGEEKSWYQEVVGWLPSIYHLFPPEPTRFSLQRFSPFFDHPSRYGISITGPIPATRYIWNLSDHDLLAIGYEVDFSAPGMNNTDDIGSLLEEAITTWRLSNAELTIRRNDDRSFQVFDSRRTPPKTYCLTDHEAYVLSCIEKPISLDALLARLGRENGLRDNYKAKAIVDALIDYDLVLQVDDQLLALPIPIDPFWNTDPALPRLRRHGLSSPIRKN